MKRSFRDGRAARSEARYPRFQPGRREFLRTLGGLVLAGPGLGALAACGDRQPRVETQDPPGVAPMHDAALDGATDAGLDLARDVSVDRRPQVTEGLATPDSMPWHDASPDTGGWPDISGGLPGPPDAAQDATRDGQGDS